MKKPWLILSLAVLAGIGAAPTSDAHQIVAASESPALGVKNVWIDPHDGKIRGTVYLRFGYGGPIFPHVHFYALDAAGRVKAEGCNRLSGSLSPARLPVGKKQERFSADLRDLTGIAAILVVADTKCDGCETKINRGSPPHGRSFQILPVQKTCARLL